jgi:hypothetical protein
LPDFFRNVLLSYTVLLDLEAPSSSQKQQMQNLNAESRFYTTAEYIFYPFEMAAVVLALLLVLHRVKDFVFGTHDGRSHEQQRAKRIILRSFVAVVVACILLSICSCFAASALFYAGATFNADAAGVCLVVDGYYNRFPVPIHNCLSQVHTPGKTQPKARD